jgi:hypothetical protein
MTDIVKNVNFAGGSAEAIFGLTLFKQKQNWSGKPM